MEKNSLSGQVLRKLIADFGVTDRLFCDGSKDHTAKGTDFIKEVQKNGIDLHVTKPGRHNQSKVEGVIREMCKKWFGVMLRKKVLHILWYYGIKWVAEIMQQSAGSAGSLHYLASLEDVIGETPDIS